MSGLDLDNTLAGYHSDDFQLLKAVIPVTADTSQAVFDCRALKASTTLRCRPRSWRCSSLWKFPWHPRLVKSLTSRVALLDTL